MSRTLQPSLDVNRLLPGRLALASGKGQVNLRHISADLLHSLLDRGGEEARRQGDQKGIEPTGQIARRLTGQGFAAPAQLLEPLLQVPPGGIQLRHFRGTYRRARHRILYCLQFFSRCAQAVLRH